MTDAPLPAILRTAACPACRYALHGLPDAGCCPECGRAFDNTIPSLAGWTVSPGSIAWRRLAAQVLVAAVVVVTICILMFIPKLPHVLYSAAVLPVLAVSVHLVPRLAIRGLRSPDARLRLEADAVDLRSPRTGGAASIPWAHVGSFAVSPVGRRLHHLYLTARPGGSGPGLPVSLVFSATTSEAQALRQLVRIRLTGDGIDR